MDRFVLFALLASVLFALAWPTLAKLVIRAYRFPDEIGACLASRYPRLSASERAEIVEGLRDVFLIARGHDAALALPSRAVADAWAAFCRDACYRKRLFPGGPGATVRGGFFADGLVLDSLRTTWRLCCELEGIDQHFPERLPRLFALDAQLAIPGGSRFSIAADNHPIGAPLSPWALTTAIEQRLGPLEPGEARRRTVSVLARRIRSTLGLWFNPGDWSSFSLTALFDAISAHDDLLVAVFGDIVTAELALDRAKAKPREPLPADGSDNTGCCCAQSAAAGEARR